MATNPPYSGTIYVDSRIITDADPTTLLSITDAGRGDRVMYDRRVSSALHFDAYLFDATFDDGLTAEIQVNPEFGSLEAARTQAQKYGPMIGRLPTVLRSRVRTVWIHQGVQPFGGGNDNLLIHTGQADQYEAAGILEETLVHEAAHTSLEDHNAAEGWIAAQEADGTFISTYARDNPRREDVAESFLCYLAVRYRSGGIIAPNANVILNTIPNRIAYFDRQAFAMHPLTSMMALNPFYTGIQRSPLENV